ncbi:MAG TPA: ribonuclease R [Usitatibacter sp.]|nr:ribonuclease R [Usitatibacter sp.]
MSSIKTKQPKSYPTEIPSREAVLAFLAEAGVPVPQEDLLERLKVRGAAEREGIERRLAAMERDGEILRNRRGALILPDKAGLIKGKVIGHPDGFGFLRPEDGREDLFLEPRQMHKVLHGDVVRARVTGVDRRGRLEAGIVEVLERANQKVVGRLFIEHGVAFVVAENKRISQDILIMPESLGGAREGQVVVAELVEQPTRNAEPIGRVAEVLGNYADPGMEIEIALRKHDLPHEWPRAALEHARKLPKAVAAKDLKGRRDLRELAFVTIDGETAKDFDDAVYCEKKGRAFRLWVAIADVGHYVRPGDPLDLEAYGRGNSVYFPRRVIPMLPEELSNELCSLRPDVDRLVMVCEMEVSSSGVVRSYDFYPGVIHSHARLTYTRVAAAIEGREPEPPVPEAAMPNIESLYAVYTALLGARRKRGAIDFETVETQMIFDENGKIERIVPVVRNDAHRLIEECMLAANVSASDFLEKNAQPTLYRVHEGPTAEKLEALRAMLKDFALTLGGGEEPQAKDYAELLERIKGRPYGAMLQTVMLRSLSQAVYSPENVGHFGLAYDAYAHFTSPIRRYPDLLVHRAIKAVLQRERYDAGNLVQLGAHCSETERRADDATRDVEAWLKSYYMQDHVGAEFDGTVSGVTSFGIFVTLDDVYVDGLVHISDLGQDYFQFDAARHMLRGDRSGVRYQLGGRVRVKVVRVDIEQSKIDFTLVVPAEAGAREWAPGESGKTRKGGTQGRKRA